MVNISLKTYDINGWKNIGDLNFNGNNFETLDKLFEYLSDEILIYMSEWWKNNYIINHNEFNIMKCKILSKNYNDLIKIKSNISNLSQIKYVNTEKIQLNNNIVKFFYYGNLNVLIKSLSLSNNLYKNINGCIITSN